MPHASGRLRAFMVPPSLSDKCSFFARRRALRAGGLVASNRLYPSRTPVTATFVLQTYTFPRLFSVVTIAPMVYLFRV